MYPAADQYYMGQRFVRPYLSCTEQKRDRFFSITTTYETLLAQLRLHITLGILSRIRPPFSSTTEINKRPLAEPVIAINVSWVSD